VIGEVAEAAVSSLVSAQWASACSRNSAESNWAILTMGVAAPSRAKHDMASNRHGVSFSGGKAQAISSSTTILTGGSRSATAT